MWYSFLGMFVIFGSIELLWNNLYIFVPNYFTISNVRTSYFFVIISYSLGHLTLLNYLTIFTSLVTFLTTFSQLLITFFGIIQYVVVVNISMVFGSFLVIWLFFHFFSWLYGTIFKQEMKHYFTLPQKKHFTPALNLHLW